VHPVGSYCTDTSRYTVNKTLNLLKTVNSFFFSKCPGFKREGACSGWSSSFSSDYSDSGLASLTATRLAPHHSHVFVLQVGAKQYELLAPNSLHGAESLRSLEILSQSRNHPRFMEPESSLRHSQCPPPVPVRSRINLIPPGSRQGVFLLFGGWARCQQLLAIEHYNVTKRLSAVDSVIT